MYSERRGETIREESWEDIDPPSKLFVFNKLSKEIENLAPGDSLSNHLSCLIERFSRGERREIVSRTVDGCTPLLKACKVGNTEVVEYLITICDADVEQKGLYEDPDDHSVYHAVAPLWCAAVAGKLAVARCLIQHGADVNSVSFTGSTPVRSACIKNRFGIVRLLVQNGANINKPNYTGGTCLINSVQSVTLCEYLIKNGANVNSQDIRNYTALYHAINENINVTAKLLLEHGANPFLTNEYNDDALQTACINGAQEIFEYLMENFQYEPKRVAEGYELLGSTFLHNENNIQFALKCWRKAANVRLKHNLEKQVKAPCKAFQFVKEFRNLEELKTLSCDLNLVQIQSLLICERILGTSHEEMLYRLLHRGAKYTDSFQYQNCINLWLYALQFKINLDTIFSPSTCDTVKLLVCLYMEILKKYKSGHITYKVSFEDAFETLELISSELPEAMKLLKIKPVFKAHQSIFDIILKALMHVIYLLLDISSTDGQKHRVALKVCRILSLDPRNRDGFSLLDLATMEPNAIFNPNFWEDEHMMPFPSMKVFEFLMECGVDVKAVKLEEGLSSMNIA